MYYYIDYIHLHSYQEEFVKKNGPQVNPRDECRHGKCARRRVFLNIKNENRYFLQS